MHSKERPHTCADIYRPKRLLHYQLRSDYTLEQILQIHLIQANVSHLFELDRALLTTLDLSGYQNCSAIWLSMMHAGLHVGNAKMAAGWRVW